MFHHSGQLQVACHRQSDASACWAPETITDSSGNNFATSGQPGLWLDRPTGRLYVYATRTSDSTGGVVCIDTTAAATNPDPFCGFTPLTAVGDAPINAGISFISDPMVVGTHWYAFNYVAGSSEAGTENTLLCFDLTSFSACQSQPYAVDIGSGPVADADFPPPATAAIASHLIIPISTGSGDELACFDASSLANCAGSWPAPLSISYDSDYGAPFPMMTSTGTIAGLCLPTGTDPCYGLDGSPATTPAGMPSAISSTSGWNGPAFVLGPRAYIPDGNSDQVECFDYSTGSSCTNFPKALTNLGLLYTVNPDPQRPTCIWVNSDNGTDQIQNFDAYTGAACGQGPIRVLASSLVAPTAACTPLSYNSLQVLSPAPTTYASGSVAFEDADGNPIAGTADLPLDSAGAVSLVGQDLSSSLGLPQFLITLVGEQGSPGDVEVQLNWTGSGPYDPGCIVSGGSTRLNYVAMGDSYSSGEGNPPYLAGSNTSTDQCHRSSSFAYPDLLTNDSALNIGQLNFVACSGATRQDAWVANAANGEPSQFSSISSTTNLVTLSLGGDDVGFVSVLEDCITGGGPFVNGNMRCQNMPVTDPTTGKKVSLSQLETQLINNLGTDSPTFCYTPSGYIDCAPSLHGLYEQIAADSAPGVKIRVLLYPHLFKTDPGPRGCTLKGAAILNFTSATIVISQANMLWINQGVDQLDTKIASEVAIAKDAGVNIEAVDPRPAYDNTNNGASPGGHGVCTAQPWINGLILDNNAADNFVNSASFHPNQTGQSHFAEALEANLGS